VRRVRRRVAAGFALLAAVGFGVAALAAVGGDGPPRPTDERPEPVASVAYVARPGDTLWSIAREIQPQGDVRPLVDELAALRHGAPLAPGDVVAWPPLPSGR
jgi:nucleoid-associated protein YgaU